MVTHKALQSKHMYQKQVLQNKKGLTVIELLISMAIFAIVGIIIINILIIQNTSFKEQQIRNKLVSDSMLVFSPVRRYSLHSDAVLESYTFETVEYTTDDDTLALQLPTLNVSGDVVNNEYDYVVFDFSGDSLHVIVDPNAQSSRSALNTLLLNNVADVIFRYNSETTSDITRFSFTINLKEVYLKTRTQEAVYTSVFSIRNISSI